MKPIHKKLSVEASLPTTGIDRLLDDLPRLQALKNKRVALLTNQSALTAHFIPTAYALFHALGESLVSLLSPEHGWSAFCAAGEDIDNTQESYTGLPVLSLFGPLFEKNLPHLQEVDTLIIDIQDVAVRCYTYVATCAKILEYISSQKYSLEVIVCDRPNPLGKTIQGPPLLPEFRSLVGYVDVPYQHGQTLGELLETHGKTLSSPPLLSIIEAPSLSYTPQTTVWVPPSPGLPDWEAVLLYPGLVLLEGTNVSEGRGSSLPFKCVAAPHLDGIQLATLLNELPASGIQARPFTFTPLSDKLKGQLCQGVQIHVLDPHQVNGLRLGLTLLSYLAHRYPLFEWVHTQGKYWIDQLTGSSQVRKDIESGQTVEAMMRSWEGI